MSTTLTIIRRLLCRFRRAAPTRFVYVMHVMQCCPPLYDSICSTIVFPLHDLLSLIFPRRCGPLASEQESVRHECSVSFVCLVRCVALFSAAYVFCLLSLALAMTRRICAHGIFLFLFRPFSIATDWTPDQRPDICALMMVVVVPSMSRLQRPTSS